MFCQNNFMVKIMVKKQKKDAYAIEVGARLRNVIDVYFGNQKKFAEYSKLNSSALSDYINGRNLISDKTATRLQNTINISKEYLLHGVLPMILDDNIKPLIARADVVVKQTSLNQLQQQYDTMESYRGFIQNYVFEARGQRETIIAQGKINIVDVTINGLENAISVSIQSPEFVEKYKSVFALKLNCSIILDKNYRIKDDVFMSVDDDFYLAIYKNENMFVDATTDKEILIAENSIVEIYGAWFSSVIRGRLK